MVRWGRGRGKKKIGIFVDPIVLEPLRRRSCLNLCGDDQAKRSLGNFVDQALSLGELGTDIDFLPGLLKR